MTTWLLQPAETLYHRAGSIRAVQGTEVNVFSRALQALERIAEAIDAPIAIAGGLAGIYHQALVTTLDIDIVVSSDQLDEFLRECQQQGLVVKRLSDRGWHVLQYQDETGVVDIEVLPSGGRTPRDPADAPPIPTPQQLGVQRGLGYASFTGWVAMKLVAGRDKDRYHLIEVLKRAAPLQISQAVEQLRSLDARYMMEFERLVQAAEQEDQRNW